MAGHYDSRLPQSQEKSDVPFSSPLFFSRVVDQWSANYNTGTGAITGTADRFQYGYDQDGNALYKDNKVSSAHGELYHANGGGGYDDLGRLTDFQRGELSTQGFYGDLPDTVETPDRTQSWSLDATGNWSSVSTNGTPATRTHNSQNQITTDDAFYYNGNGDLYEADAPGGAWGYDAWNRMDFGDGYIAGLPHDETYSFDALGRRIVRAVDQEVYTDYFYSDQWQVIEERVDGSTSDQYVWSPVYVDAMVLRDHDTDANGSLDQRLYALQDANYNVTGVVNTSGSVVERYLYDPYGAFTVIDDDWSSDSDGLSDVDWVYLHQGGRYDAISATYDFRHRDYSPTLGRWMQQDVAGYVDGVSLYEFGASAPLHNLDPNGLTRVRIDADAFIPSDWIQQPFPAGGYLKGDNRSISPTPGAHSRIASWIEVETDESVSRNPRIAWGATQSESHFKFQTDSPERVKVGSGMYTLEAVRRDANQVMVYVQQTGREPRSNAGIFGPFAPAIDYSYQIGLTHCGSFVNFWIKGEHDGFPAYELYLNGHLEHSHDPGVTGDSPMALYGSGDIEVAVRGYLEA